MLRKPSWNLSPAGRAIERGRSRLILANAFWGTLCMRLEPVETYAVPTMGVDGSHLFFNPDYTLGLSEAEVLGVLVHEVSHCANMHHVRRGDRDFALWNVAADLQVNLDVIGCGFRLPGEGRSLKQFLAGQKGFLFDRAFTDMGAEEIYRLVAEAKARRNPPPPPPDDDEEEGDTGEAEGQGPDGQPGSNPAPEGDDEPEGNGPGKPGEDEDEGDGAGNGPPEPQGASPDAPNDGDGAGVAGDQETEPTGAGGPANGNSPDEGKAPAGATDPGGCGGVLDAAPPHDPVAKAEADREWQTAVRQAAAVARSQAGTLPGYAKRIIEQMDHPRVDWRAELRRFTDQSISKDYSWAKPNRRHLWRRIILPGLISDRPAHVVVVQDTSGSVFHGKAQETFVSEMQAILDEGAVDRLTIVQADTRVAGEPVSFEAGDIIAIEAAGGGGTDFREPLDWIRDNVQDAAAIVYLTDGETCDWGDEPSQPILWAIFGEEARARAAAEAAPFGEVLFIGD